MKYIFSIIFFIGISVAVPVHVLAADIPPASLPVSANKRIDVDLSEQRLRYYHGDYEMGSFLISSVRLASAPFPRGTACADGHCAG